MNERSIPPLAIVGMAGRFPGSTGLNDFWALLQEGRSAVRTLSEEELRAAGVGEDLLSNPAYVRCCVPLEHADLFDADFFGYSPRQAASIDPQQRLFLECAWEALERAGYGAIAPGVTAAVFGGSGNNGYLARSLSEDLRSDPENLFQSLTDAGKDFMTCRVAYKLGLTGPAVTVQTGCSTSLVAVHLASQSLLSYECDIALAGGASVMLPPHTGYLYTEGGIQSRDGACRAFESDASGCIRGNAVGVLVLRRLADALADGDSILAIIRSTAVNNDGARKVGFTAPGLDAQVRLLRTGLELAELSPSDIDFLETHGTGTALGDSIELTALQEVYAPRRTQRVPCVLGAVKTNIGHADTAAGAVGLIKTVMSLRHKVFLPNAGFRSPNAMLASEESVFRICQTAEPWPAQAGRPRTAGVSSFGIGGTNAHVLLQEAPEPQREVPDEREAHLLPVSARTHAALEQSCRDLAMHLDTHALSVADVAFTLQVGRRGFDHRRFVVGHDLKEIVGQLRTMPAARNSALDTSGHRPVIFLFPGQGAQRVGMLQDIHATDRELAQDVKQCAAKMLDLQGPDLRKILCHSTAELDVDDTSITQPALFVAEYCLARFWLRQGLTPAAVLGHSVGEYAAACVAGALALDDALRLVVWRARASRELPEGAMVAINRPEAEVRGLLTPDVQITAVNTSWQCVVSGVCRAMQPFMEKLASNGIEYQRLAVSKPFHTQAAAPLAEEMLRVARPLAMREPRITWVSTVTAARMSAAESKNPQHWARHVLQPVRFAEALRALGGHEKAVFLEVGPGRVLTGLARQELGSSSVFASLPPAGPAARENLLATLGELWLAGADIDFATQPRRGRRRVELPPHPLNRGSHLRGSASVSRQQTERPDGARLAADQWFNVPTWERSLFPAGGSHDAASGAWLVLADPHGLADLLVGRLRQAGQEVICIRPGTRLAIHSRDEYEVSTAAPVHFEEILARVDREGRTIGRIIHCATLTALDEDSLGEGVVPAASAMTLTQIARLSRRLGRRLSLLVVTNRLYDISGAEQPCPGRAVLPVFCRCMAQESANIRCVVVDLPPPVHGASLASQYAPYASRLLAELESGGDPSVAYRQDWRFVQTHSRVELARGGPALRRLEAGGHYVITGGLGQLGLALAARLARECQAKLLLIGRRSFPEPVTWSAIAATGSSAADADAARARQLLQLEAAGAEVMVAAADVSDAAALARVLALAEQRFGPVRGVFHLAADLKHISRHRRMDELQEADLQSQARPKVAGLRALLAALGGRSIDFGVAFSSTSAVLAGVGYGAYAAANAVMDCMIVSRVDPRLSQWMSLNWDGWAPAGAGPDPHAVSFEEGCDALLRVCRFSSAPQLVISATALEPRFDTWVRMKRPAPLRTAPAAHPAAEGVSKVLPRTELERQIADIWRDLLGLETLGVTESFLDLGGDSLIGVRVISRIKEVFRVKLSPASLLAQNSTVESLSRDIVRALAEMQPAAAGQGSRA